MNYKSILGLLVVLLAVQTAPVQGQTIFSFVFSVVSVVYSLFEITLLPFGESTSIFQLISLIFSGITIAPAPKAMAGIRACGCSSGTAMASYMSAMNAMASSCSSTAAQMSAGAGSLSQSESAMLEAITTSYTSTTQIMVFLIQSLAAIMTLTPPAPSPFVEPPLPAPPANLTNATLVVNVTVSAQATWFISYIPFIIQQINATGSSCGDAAASVNANCSCPNATTVQEVIAMWQNVTLQIESMTNITIVNGTLIANMNTTVSGTLVQALNATNQLLIKQQACAKCLAAGVKARRYRALDSCTRSKGRGGSKGQKRSAGSCKRHRSKEIKRAKSIRSRVRKARTEKGKRAKASREKRVRKAGKKYVSTMGMGIGKFLRNLRYLFIPEMISTLTIYGQYMQYLQANISTAVETIADNTSSLITGGETNLTEYINNATVLTDVAIANATATILSTTDPSSNCTTYANATLALLAYFNDEVQKCSQGLETNITKIYANVTYISSFGLVYNQYTSACDRCVRQVCGGWFCFFRRRLRRDRSGLDLFQACQEPLTASIVNASLSINITISSVITIVQTQVTQSVEAAKACVDTKVNQTLAVLAELVWNWQLCVDPTATTTTAATTTADTTTEATTTTGTTVAGATTDTTAAVTTTAATTTAATTTAATTTTKAPCPYPACTFSGLQAILALAGLGTSSTSVACVPGGACPGITYAQAGKCCCR